jgi:hypothetical protein
VVDGTLLLVDCTVSQLGSIFDGLPTGGDAPRGLDLRAEIRLPRAHLGRGPVTIRLPAELPTLGGGLALRTPGPGEAADQVTLNLPRGTPDGVTLRLRGQGARAQAGPPGDLLLKVWLVGPAAPGPLAAEPRSDLSGPESRPNERSNGQGLPRPDPSGGLGRPLFGLLLGGGVLALLGWLATRALG